MAADLPSDFDVIVFGTGLPDSIVAAAAARVGKSVLHLDCGEFYGSLWGSLSFQALESWAAEAASSEVEEPPSIPEGILQDGETAVALKPSQRFVYNVEMVPETSSEGVHTPEVESPPESPLEALRKASKRFNLDLSPKLLYSRGSLVNLLISSNTTRYAEFKAVTRVLTLHAGQLELVPVTRADVFATKNISVIEKRMLMKFLTSCLTARLQQVEEQPQEWQDESLPIQQYLEAQKLPANLQHYIIYAIAMCERDTPTPQAMKAIERFLSSLGYYGNSPFLWPIYGNGELPQGFCRLCAVFGGTYYLKRGVEHAILGPDGACTGIITEGQRIGCKWLVADSSYVSSKEILKDAPEYPRLSKAILITNSSLLPSEREEITLLRLPAGDPANCSVTVIEVGAGSLSCPQGYFVVYLTSSTSHSKLSAQEELKPVVDRLFAPLAAEEEEDSRPNIIWALYYNQLDSSTQDLPHLPQGLLLTPSPGQEHDYATPVTKARAIFQHMYPDEEFLPRAPDPDEIILEPAEEPTGTGEPCQPAPVPENPPELQEGSIPPP